MNNKFVLPQGIKIGHANDAYTGATVILADGAVGGVSVRGGAPGTRETDMLRADKSQGFVDAVVLSGGSAYGLEASCGVVEYLREQNIGFAAGDKVDATAISKGKGFQGAIKRHNQSRGPMTHGSKFHRHAGSNGAASDPSKVFKGKKMPGQMGNKQITVQNLEVVRVDVENNLLLIKGSVPGPKKCLVTVKEAVKTER